MPVDEHSLLYDTLVCNDYFKERIADPEFAHDFYCALCNTDWRRYKNGQTFNFTFRGAGGFVADLRNQILALKKPEIYMDWYCGIKTSTREGTVTNEVRDFMKVIKYKYKSL